MGAGYWVLDTGFDFGLQPDFIKGIYPLVSTQVENMDLLSCRQR
jgi:hypothetical protein